MQVPERQDKRRGKQKKKKKGERERNKERRGKVPITFKTFNNSKLLFPSPSIKKEQSGILSGMACIKKEREISKMTRSMALLFWNDSRTW